MNIQIFRYPCLNIRRYLFQNNLFVDVSKDTHYSCELPCSFCTSNQWNYQSYNFFYYFQPITLQHTMTITIGDVQLFNTKITKGAKLVNDVTECLQEYK